MRDVKGQVTRMAYDSLNRLTRTTYPDGLFETATYDAAGRTLTKTDREGNVTSSSYDAVGRLAQVVSPSDTISRSYDAAGQLLQLSSSLGAITYAYDSRGWVRQLTQVLKQTKSGSSWGALTTVATYSYDANGARAMLCQCSGIP